MKTLNKIIQTIIFTAIIFGASYYFRDDINLAWQKLNKQVSPCGEPIVYSIGDFDKRFNITEDDFLKAVSQAAQIWEQPVNKKLFNYAENGSLKINLIYDSRQDATIKLENLGVEINNDQSTYESLKKKYDSFVKAYDAQKIELDKLVKGYQIEKASYEEEVKRLNKRGGARLDEYARLEQERNDLNNLVTAIKQAQGALNRLVDNINAVANVINRLIYELNLNVGNYNTIGEKAAGEFQEGEYVSDAAGERINIYQFNNKEILVRLLAHELGHALGLEHLDNQNAIMYRLNQENNEKITADDIAGLKAVCGIK